jgi:aryl-alcohol dehydrogenase-like predicted oxidoreductase
MTSPLPPTLSEVENSLRRLRIDHIDLYQIHHPYPHTDIEETLSALTDLVRSGKVRAIGSSNLPTSEIVEAQWVADRRRLQRFRAEQPPYSILSARSCPPASATAWACWRGVRWRWAC